MAKLTKAHFYPSGSETSICGKTIAGTDRDIDATRCQKCQGILDDVELSTWKVANV
jgi:hypothetical protein